jgi:hypothetical protein
VRVAGGLSDGLRFRLRRQNQQSAHKARRKPHIVALGVPVLGHLLRNLLGRHPIRGRCTLKTGLAKLESSGPWCVATRPPVLNKIDTNRDFSAPKRTKIDVNRLKIGSNRTTIVPNRAGYSMQAQTISMI